MQDAEETFTSPLVGLPRGAWVKKLAEISQESGFFQSLGSRHFATFIEDKPKLLVTFETVRNIREKSEASQPLGWNLVKNIGWSHLCIACDGETWFRDPKVIAFFDRLVDDGFFDAFNTTVFYGAGSCGYAAAAYSVAAPGSIVVAIQPQATLDPRVTEWDDRFTKMRRENFTHRYAYAPDMLDAAKHAYVLYDPAQTNDAMHAALFTRSNVTKFRLPHMGGKIEDQLAGMKVLFAIISKAATGKLTTLEFANVFRARRENRSYLRNLLDVLEAKGRNKHMIALCKFVIASGNAPFFKRRLAQLNAEEKAKAEQKQ